ncbi:hypothetical protein [Salmon gill poxvirus]
MATDKTTLTRPPLRSQYTVGEFTKKFFPENHQEDHGGDSGSYLRDLLDDPVSNTELLEVTTVIFTSVYGSYTNSLVKSMGYNKKTATSLLNFVPRPVGARQYDIYKGLGYNGKSLMVVGIDNPANWYRLDPFIDFLINFKQVFCMISMEHWVTCGSQCPVSVRGHFMKVFVDVHNNQECNNPDFVGGLRDSDTFWDKINPAGPDVSSMIDTTMELLKDLEHGIQTDTQIRDSFMPGQVRRSPAYVSGIYNGLASCFMRGSSLSRSQGVFPDDMIHPSCRDTTGPRSFGEDFDDYDHDHMLLDYTHMTMERFGSFLGSLDSYNNLKAGKNPVFVFGTDFWKLKCVLTVLESHCPTDFMTGQFDEDGIYERDRVTPESDFICQCLDCIGTDDYQEHQDNNTDHEDDSSYDSEDSGPCMASPENCVCGKARQETETEEFKDASDQWTDSSVSDQEGARGSPPSKKPAYDTAGLEKTWF